jgi:hypothetical protein
MELIPKPSILGSATSISAAPLSADHVTGKFFPFAVRVPFPGAEVEFPILTFTEAVGSTQSLHLTFPLAVTCASSIQTALVDLSSIAPVIPFQLIPSESETP